MKEYLETRPEITKVYFNEAGEYIFHPHPSFPIEKTREEALAETPVETAEGDEGKKKKK
jgi:hypothetical protein